MGRGAGGGAGGSRGIRLGLQAEDAKAAAMATGNFSEQAGDLLAGAVRTGVITRPDSVVDIALAVMEVRPGTGDLGAMATGITYGTVSALREAAAGRGLAVGNAPFQAVSGLYLAALRERRGG